MIAFPFWYNFCVCFFLSYLFSFPQIRGQPSSTFQQLHPVPLSGTFPQGWMHPLHCFSQDLPGVLCPLPSSSSLNWLFLGVMHSSFLRKDTFSCVLICWLVQFLLWKFKNIFTFYVHLIDSWAQQSSWVKKPFTQNFVNVSPLPFTFQYFLPSFLSFSEAKGGRKRGRGHLCEREPWLVASRMCPNGGPQHVSQPEIKPVTLCSVARCLANWATPVRANVVI